MDRQTLASGLNKRALVLYRNSPGTVTTRCLKLIQQWSHVLPMLSAFCAFSGFIPTALLGRKCYLFALLTYLLIKETIISILPPRKRGPTEVKAWGHLVSI